MRRRGLGVGVALLVPAVGLGVAACGSSSSTQAATTTSAAATTAKASGSGGFAGHAASGGDSNARSTDAAGGALGTVTSVTSSGFTLSPPGGGAVTVKETSSTVYEQGAGTQKSSASAVTKRTEVLVLGKVNSTTITATQVLIKPNINLKTASANVISFQQGESGSTKSVGQIPKDYTQGSGKLVSGTKANEAIEAALKSYAGGVIDRVVQLGSGEYEVHHIGVNWPHHIFVNKNFKVVGAND
ncbi:MAG TPA: hypothetical protein VHV75_18455 [Solirubrobacteraceae bacterium]|jgi:hypothetical protein|nr:hypothetical protein [Solirubrobacteraceae bacterium]